MSVNNKKSNTGLGVKKENNESVGSLSRRFNQKVRSSGILLDVRAKKFNKRIPNRIARRKSALVRAQRRKEYEKLRKWGKVK